MKDICSVDLVKILRDDIPGMELKEAKAVIEELLEDTDGLAIINALQPSEEQMHEMLRTMFLNKYTMSDVTIMWTDFLAYMEKDGTPTIDEVNDMLVILRDIKEEMANHPEDFYVLDSELDEEDE